jgi:ketosteroid isomerase-like protein
MQSMCLALAVLAACTAKEARRTDSAAGSAAPTLAGAPAPDANAVKQAVDASNARFVAATLKSDTVGMTGEYTDDAILQPGDMKPATGRASIAHTWAQFAAVETPTAFTINPQDIIVAGDYAIQVGSYDYTARLKKGGKSRHDIGKFLAVFKKQPDGSYKMIRDSFSSDTLPPK